MPSSDKAAVIGSPKFTSPGNATSRANASGYHLQEDSPDCFAGASIPDNGGVDFFGNSIPSDGPAIGADQGSCGA